MGDMFRLSVSHLQALLFLYKNTDNLLILIMQWAPIHLQNLQKFVIVYITLITITVFIALMD